MNHKFYSVNVSNSGSKKQESSFLSDFILEKELKEIYDTQYNDLFPDFFLKHNCFKIISSCSMCHYFIFY